MLGSGGLRLDLVIFALPIFMVSRLQLPIKKKLGIIVALDAGAL